MASLQQQTNFSLQSKVWKQAKAKEAALLEQGEGYYGKEVNINEVCTKLLHFMKMKQYNNIM